jgi:hypothetical protein
MRIGMLDQRWSQSAASKGTGSNVLIAQHELSIVFKLS